MAEQIASDVGDGCTIARESIQIQMVFSIQYSLFTIHYSLLNTILNSIQCSVQYSYSDTLVV